ncbi:MAG: MFS transporter [Fuerstiella sp.]|nr:MFS transporter [Fuerstiella sp.]MCP4510593.1 MFS transporter [Fuerstiella sp.]
MADSQIENTPPADSVTALFRDPQEVDSVVPAASAEVAAPARKSVGTLERTSDPVFIFSYLANLTVVTANAATFIFADWVAWLAAHGSGATQYHEELPGRVIQYGVIAAITVRIFLGQSIDRFGVRRVWLFMSALNFFGLAIFASLTQLSPMLYAGRILFAVGLAGMFTCGTFHIQSCVTERRRTEFIALFGSSGFIGMILGPQLSDVLRSLCNDNADDFFPRVFQATVVLIAAYIVFLIQATRGLSRPEKHPTRPSLIRLTRDYWPGWVMLVAVAMGIVFTVPSLYLVRFTRHADFGGIATYWTTYAIMAFAFRLRTAALSQRVGRYRLIFCGLMFQGFGLWALIPVTESWHLLFSASLCGFGHALLFPSIVSLGSGTFPARYRGSGTNLTLGCLDLGVGFSAPLLGMIIDLPTFDGVGFRQMFFVAGAMPLIVATIWFLVKRHHVDSETQVAHTAEVSA